MVVQPSGLVTLVFTDIEGSTRLLRELGEAAYGEGLARHRRIVREAFALHSGYEVDYEGDAFFYAFPSAVDAVAAVAEAMGRLELGPIRVRVGVHTGRPVLDPPKYVGMDVHLAARVMSVGYGGQVLLTKATRDLLDVELRDLASGSCSIATRGGSLSSSRGSRSPIPRSGLRRLTSALVERQIAAVTEYKRCAGILIDVTSGVALTRVGSYRRGWLGSCIESERDLVSLLLAPKGELAPLARDHKAALRQHAHRRGVVARSVSVKRTG